MADQFGCVGSAIRLRSGRYIDLAAPQPEDVTLDDIAGALSKLCRFGGQCEWFYSVAEHCWHCARQAAFDGLTLETQVVVLMHDAAEAFVGDVVKPLKNLLPSYGDVERRIEAAIAKRFGISFDRESENARKIDYEMLIAERRVFFSADDVVWSGESDVRQLRVEFRKWLPPEAELAFVRLTNQLGIK